MSVEDEGLLAAKHETVVRRFRHSGCGIGIVAVRLLEREGHEALAGADARQQFGFLRIAAANVDRGAANPDARKQRARPQRTPRLFRDHAQALVTECQAAEGLRKRNARPTEFRHRLPGVAVESVRGVLVPQPPQLRDGHVVGAEVPGRILEHVLLFVEYHWHGVGNP